MSKTKKLSPDGTPYHAYDDKGRPICGARNRFDEPCQLSPVKGKKRCKWHGGASLSGTEHPNFKTGRYIKRSENLSVLGASVVRQLNDPEYKSLIDEIALHRARIDQLVSYIETSDRLVSADLVKRAYDLICQGMDNKDVGALISGRETLKHAMNKLVAEAEIWDEIRAASSVIQRLVANDVQTQKIEREWVRSTDLTLLFAGLQQVILDNVPEPDRRKAIQEGFRMALLERRLLVTGDG